MTLAERIRAMAESLPTERSSVQLSKADLLAMLEEAGSAECAQGSADEEQLMDLSVDDIMEATGKARSTVIGWIKNDGLESYMFGREHRITRVAWQAFLQKKRAKSQPPEPDVRSLHGAPRPRAVDELGSWRDTVAVAGGNR